MDGRIRPIVIHPEHIRVQESQTDYDRLIAPIESQMMRTVWRVLRDAGEADEALQDALVRIWNRLTDIRQADNPHALVLKVCADAAYDRLRQRIRHRQRRAPMPAEPPSREKSPSNRAMSEEFQALVLEAIERLPRKQAIAVMMRIVQGQPYANIATALECGEATARTHVARGRARLRELVACFSDSAPQNRGNSDG